MEDIVVWVSIGLFLAAEECSLRSIGLGGNGITAAGGLALAKALRVNKSLESLGLAGNVLGMWFNYCIISCYSVWIGAFPESEGCEYICEALRVNTTLRKLILSSNGIDDFGVKALADSLTVNATLHTLVRFFKCYFVCFLSSMRITAHCRKYDDGGRCRAARYQAIPVQLIPQGLLVWIN